MIVETSDLDALMMEKYPRWHAYRRPLAYLEGAWSALMLLYLFAIWDGSTFDAHRVPITLALVLILGLYLIHNAKNRADLLRRRTRREWEAEHEPWLARSAVKAFRRAHFPDADRITWQVAIGSLCAALAAMPTLLALVILHLSHSDPSINQAVLWAYLAASMVASIFALALQDVLNHCARRAITLLRAQGAL